MTTQRGAPAHVVLVTLGSSGDLFPFLRLGLRLRARGQRVTLLAPWLHEAHVRRAGLAFHPLPGDAGVLDHPDVWHPTRGFRVLWEATRAGTLEMRRFVGALPVNERCVLLVHPLALAEADLCRAARPNVKVIAAFLAPSNIQSVHDPLMLGPWRVPGWVPHAWRRWLWRAIGNGVIDPVALPGINQARRELGLAPAPGLFAHWKQIPDLSLGLFPAWFAGPRPDWPTPWLAGDFALYDPQSDAALSPALTRFLSAGPAPIVATHGTANRQARQFFADVLQAAARLGRRVVLLTPLREQLPQQLPAGALWQDYASLVTLLPHAACLIHHGGVGTTAEALRAGVPQLIVALAYDQFDNGARVTALGAGRWLRASNCNRRRLIKELGLLLESEQVRVACVGAQQSFQPARFERMLDSLVTHIETD